MVHICFLKSCNSEHKRGINIKFHGFPTDFLMRKKWVEALQIERSPKTHSKLCSLHFKKSDYNESRRARRPGLKTTAVPSRNLPNRIKKDRFDSDFSDGSDSTVSFPFNTFSDDGEDSEEECSVNTDKNFENVAMSHQNASFICRACLSTKQSSGEFSLMFENDLELHFKEITEIDIRSDDNLTKLLCPACSDLVNKFKTFKELCVRSDALLKHDKKIPTISIKHEKHDEKPIVKAVHEGNLNEFVSCSFDESCDNDIVIDSSMPISEPSSPQVIVKLEITADERMDDHTKLMANREDQNEDATYLEANYKDQKICMKQEELAIKVEKSNTNSRKKNKVVLDQNRIQKSKEKYAKSFKEKGVLQCPHCQKQFTKLNTFYKHRAEHLKTNMCDLCGSIFASSRSLANHHIYKHSDLRKYVCALCSSAFKMKATLEDHLLMRHNSERNFVCERCSNTFKSKKSLQKHHRVVHLHTEAIYPCDQCDKKFRTRANLKNHQFLHTGHKPFMCELCSKGFTTKQFRDRHFKKHGKPDLSRPYQCSICLQLFKKSEYHRRHLKRFHMLDLNALNSSNNFLSNEISIQTETISQPPMQSPSAPTPDTNSPLQIPNLVKQQQQQLQIIANTADEKPVIALLN